MNKQHTAYEEGFVAYQHGQAYKNNPYDRDINAFDAGDWADGWIAADYNNEMKNAKPHPYVAGRLAQINGHDYNANPHDPITHPAQAREWRAGWLDAEETERIDAEETARLEAEKAAQLDAEKPKADVIEIEKEQP